MVSGGGIQPWKASLLAAIIVGFALRLWFVFALPFGQTVENRIEGLNDEPAHLNYVRHISEHRTFPVQRNHVQEPGSFERGDFEYYQPPLYYFLAAPLYGFTGENHGLYACRLLSFFFGLLTVLLLAGILALLGIHPDLRLAGAALGSLFLTHVYFSSVVSNDSLSWFIAAAVTALCLIMVRQVLRTGETGRLWYVVIGVLCGLGLLTKSSCAVLFFPAALTFSFISVRRKSPRPVVYGFLFLLLGIVIAIPWYLRNAVLYGSIFALETGFGPHSPMPLTVSGVFHMLQATAKYLWFPMQHVPCGSLVHLYRLLGEAMVVFSVAATVLFYWRRRMAFPHALLWSTLLLVFSLYVTLNLRWCNPEGRFLFPALPGLLVLLLMPAIVLHERRAKLSAFLWIAAVALYPYAYFIFAGR